MLTNVDIQQEIQERLNEKCLSADEVLVRLGEQARSISKESEGKWIKQAIMQVKAGNGPTMMVNVDI